MAETTNRIGNFKQKLKHIPEQVQNERIPSFEHDILITMEENKKAYESMEQLRPDHRSLKALNFKTGTNFNKKR